ncbi:MAG: hypothetical protein J0H43_05765, partial [Actinobacteria bacterium]|nr:hypothetical protein [Actinomycetota bacterium]
GMTGRAYGHDVVIGSSTLEITGVEGLYPTSHDAVADRIVAGTWAMAALATRGDVTVRGANAGHLEIALDKVVQAGATVEALADGFRVAMDRRPRSFDVVTLPYPGLATDLQPQAIAALSVADGTAMITENLFEARFMFCDEIARMGADVRTDGHHAVIRGRERLSGAPVRATDIRAGVGLVIDFLTYVLVPVVALWRSDLMPTNASFWLGLIVTIASALYFADVRMKTDDLWFRGFPAAWNIVGPVMYLMEAREGVGAVITLILSVLSLTNMPYPHIARAKFMRWWTAAGATCWIGGVAIGTLTLPHHHKFVRWMLYVGSAYFVVLAGIRWWHERRNPPEPPAAPAQPAPSASEAG